MNKKILLFVLLSILLVATACSNKSELNSTKESQNEILKEKEEELIKKKSS